MADTPLPTNPYPEEYGPPSVKVWWHVLATHEWRNQQKEEIAHSALQNALVEEMKAPTLAMLEAQERTLFPTKEEEKPVVKKEEKTRYQQARDLADRIWKQVRTCTVAHSTLVSTLEDEMEIQFARGRINFEECLVLDVEHVVLRGAPDQGTHLHFSMNDTTNPLFKFNASHIRIEGFHISFDFKDQPNPGRFGAWICNPGVVGCSLVKNKLDVPKGLALDLVRDVFTEGVEVCMTEPKPPSEPTTPEEPTDSTSEPNFGSLTQQAIAEWHEKRHRMVLCLKISGEANHLYRMAEEKSPMDFTRVRLLLRTLEEEAKKEGVMAPSQEPPVEGSWKEKWAPCAGCGEMQRIHPNDLTCIRSGCTGTLDLSMVRLRPCDPPLSAVDEPRITLTEKESNPSNAQERDKMLAIRLMELFEEYAPVDFGASPSPPLSISTQDLAYLQEHNPALLWLMDFLCEDGGMQVHIHMGQRVETQSVEEAIMVSRPRAWNPPSPQRLMLLTSDDDTEKEALSPTFTATLTPPPSATSVLSPSCILETDSSLCPPSCLESPSLVSQDPSLSALPSPPQNTTTTSTNLEMGLKYNSEKEMRVSGLTAVMVIFLALLFFLFQHECTRSLFPAPSSSSPPTSSKPAPHPPFYIPPPVQR